MPTAVRDRHALSDITTPTPRTSTHTSQHSRASAHPSPPETNCGVDLALCALLYLLIIQHERLTLL